MRNILKSKEAGVMPFVVIAVLIIVIAGFAVFMNPEIRGSEPYWETESEFGVWQDEVIIEFEDGSTESLKIIGEKSPAFAVLYEGKEITNVRFVCSALATGAVYTKAVIDRSQTMLTVYIKSGGTNKYVNQVGYSGTVDAYIGGSAKQVSSMDIPVKTRMDDDPVTFPNGAYSILFITSGIIKYKGSGGGVPDSEWKTISMPPSRTIHVLVERTPQGSILVTLSSGITPY